MIFQRIQTSFAKEPYDVVILCLCVCVCVGGGGGGVRIPCSPLGPRM